MTMHHPRSRKRNYVFAGAAGLLLGVPASYMFLPHSLSRTADAAEPAVGRSDSLLQAIVDRETQELGVAPPDASGGVQPASGELLVQYQQAAPATEPYQQSPQYQASGQFSGGEQSEVQRELQMLYQQDGREMPRMDIPQFSTEARQYAPVSGRRSKPWDFLNPTLWKRKFEQNRRQARQPQQTEQFQSGPAAPLPQMPVTAPPALPAQSPPVVEQPRPRVQRVSPEIFAQDPSSPTVPDEQHPYSGQPGPFPGPVELAHPAVSEAPPEIPTESTSGAPLLIILPDPSTAAEAPPADAGGFAEPRPAPLVDAPVSEPDAGGLPAWAQEEPSARQQRPLPNLEESLDGAGIDPLADPFPAGSEAEADKQPGPYSGLQLEMDPYGEPLPALPSTPPAEQGPVIAPGVPSYDTGRFAPAGDLPAVPPHSGGPSLDAPGGLQPPAELPRVVPQQPLPIPQAGLNAPSAAEQSSSAADKMARIAARQGLKGFKGFCPVMLRDYRELADAKLEHSAIYQGNQYWFSSAEARQAFIANPGAYVPASGGIDVVLFQQSARQELGSLDYAVWYRGKLYLFTSEATKAEFVSSPRTHALDQAAAP